MKVCTRCKIKKDESKFCKDKTRKDGLYCHCRECKSSSRKQYYSTKKEEIKEKAAIWAKNNREKSRAIKNRWFITNKERINNQNYEKYHSDSSYKNAVIERCKKYRRTENGLSKSRVQCKKASDQLKDYYVKNQLIQKSGFKKEQLENHPILIDIKRIIFQINRKLKN